MTQIGVLLKSLTVAIQNDWIDVEAARKVVIGFRANSHKALMRKQAEKEGCSVRTLYRKLKASAAGGAR